MSSIISINDDEIVFLPVEWRTQEGNKVADCVDNNDIWSAERSAMTCGDEK